MLTVYNCIVHEHDLRLVALAALICGISSFSAVNLLRHVDRSTHRNRYAWLMIAATSTGFGIWATHFIAMIAFSPGIPNAYNTELSVLSLAAAVLLTAAGMWIATLRGGIDHYLVGGAVLGAGIGTMHYTGMAAFEVQGRIVWDHLLVGISLVAGIALAALSLFVVLRRPSTLGTIGAAVLLTLAICTLHFIAMGAVSIYPDSSIAISQYTIEPMSQAFAAAAASLVILVLSAAALWIDLRFRRHQAEAERMHGLANAAVEGLIVCDGTRIVSANDSIAALSGIASATLNTMVLGDLFGERAATAMAEADGQARETELKSHDGTAIPVELIARTIDYCGKPHGVVAVRDIRERKKAEQEIIRLAHYDPLTGLANRRSFNSRLEAEIAAAGRGGKGGQLALMLLDLDRFKEVNDLFGHAAGDAMLQKVAQCASAKLRHGQMLARLGGDEFAIIAPNLPDPQAAGRIAEAVLSAMREENRLSPGGGLVSASIGIALYPLDADEQASLVSHADTALYRAKAEGKDTYRYFEASMGAEARDRRVMEHDLRQAVARGEFRLVYQPQKEISTGRMIGFEALLRWHHPEHGDISPAVFIPVAEDSGAIIQIGEWVLSAACEEAARWKNPLMVAVNVSAVQLHNPNFSRKVHEVLLRSGLAPGRLELEITETALVKDMPRALAALRQIKALGVRVAMDDFGTGYSSLSNLRAFPFDKIKIDGSFIKSVDRNGQVAAIVRAVLGLGRGLGLPVLAEGVETLGELKFLDAEDCEIGQGFYLGRPGPIEAFGELTGVPSEKEDDGAGRSRGGGSILMLEPAAALRSA
ncbi:GGDEF and EAL domain-containing protein [Mesorhizobium sp. M4B.F.Ca.ET.215.01.1.1]|uniref:sensor domain-containing diguanylate cyclase n=2 Tax=Mesorhizobium TaxID=68287 RepID=UPI000FCA8376|nr:MULTISPECIES: EAL domain-containing protein [unclassified Mesorhizobium]RVD43492.1 GGDEF and EAL domain-containing protein [Mesorhizobium sp. M4B.F.Ca.ET.019.03.1.1]RWF64215.1 MAG: GGDEF and EAL domain-containing protein [Mesorhizobium sp.]TGQ06025.1 GGDEF and EAL domain-containing protein [Mesorhizobium sp. M4B.F.Ca.ET.215.01.1.1]TGQ30155.1 GGDEF and EAL domain-containing protein [Mesorhizobium sp. M4B.F.Ca.ET.214.01.1.1]TGQ32072.1 GGDEF and EAL domain-containing protein [Mesorhizobium sp.